jgi:uncharacterized membrane protein
VAAEGIVARLNTPRHRGFYTGITAGLVVGLILLVVAPGVALVGAANVFFAAYLVVAVHAATTKLTASYLRQHADEDDAPAIVIFFVTIGAVAVSAVSLFVVLMGGKEAPALQLSMSIASVILGWLAVHTMWAMHYAYEYYASPDEGIEPGGVNGAAGGLQFPGSDAPDGTAFLYFSYVIGMTAQTSDTEVCSNAMRRIVTTHGIFSFFFNTVIVAAAVNIAVTLAH